MVVVSGIHNPYELSKHYIGGVVWCSTLWCGVLCGVVRCCVGAVLCWCGVVTVWLWQCVRVAVCRCGSVSV